VKASSLSEKTIPGDEMTPIRGKAFGGAIKKFLRRDHVRVDTLTRHGYKGCTGPEMRTRRQGGIRRRGDPSSRILQEGERKEITEVTPLQKSLIGVEGGGRKKTEIGTGEHIYGECPPN